MCDPLARLLEVRVRFRRNPQARAYVDRALAIVAKALAGESDLSSLDDEAGRLAEELEERFGAAQKVSVP